MTDSFADLWNSTAPSRPPTTSTSNQRLGAASPNTSLPQSGQRRAQHDVFAMLAATNNTASSSSSSPRPITPGQPQSKPTSASAKPGGGGSDAFSDLFGGSSGVARNDAKLTMAERAAKAQKEQLARLHGQRQQSSSAQPSSTASAWSGLDSLASLSTTSRPSTKPAPNSSLLDDWGFDSAPSSKSPAPAKPSKSEASKAASAPQKVEDDWGFDGFASPKPRQPTPQATSSSRKPQGSLWDLDDFATEPASSRTDKSKEPQRYDSPGEFDFGDREDREHGRDSGDEDDILGDLAKPVDAVKRPLSRAVESQSPVRSSPAPRKNGSPPTRAVSPPPHILGQLVEMGFSIQQARVALASTDTGLDVQAALEILLANGAADGSHPNSRPESRESRQATHERRPSSRSDPLPQRRATRDSQTSAASAAATERNLQEQADKLLAQASEIGLSMFNRANALWKEGREKVQKVYEERAAANTSGGGAGRPNSRPRWMQDAPDQPAGDDGWGDQPAAGGFSDEVETPESPTAHPRRPKPAKQAPQTEAAPAPAPQRGNTVNLFGDAPVYASRFRHGRPKPTPAASQTSGPSTATPPPPAAPSAPRAIHRQNIVSATPSAISSSAKHKEAGTARFKLGQYGESESSYTLAISALPLSHLLLIPLYNNRALTRLKNGDYKGAAEDASSVLEIAGEGYHPALELKVEREEEGSSVDIADSVMKALKRRAEAWEGREKWEDAVKDWEKLAALDWVKSQQVRNEAIKGAVRCRKMLKSGNEDSDGAGNNARGQDGGLDGLEEMMGVKPRPPPPTKPKPTAALPRKSAVAVSNKPSEALANLRTANSKAEAEDQARHELKDVVDQKLAAWKTGKETNIRALIASLDLVLWPELDLPKVGMADLVTPGQVKVKYTKTIAKLHPDKLNTSNTTVEQRMIANAVFGTLNEAWNAFKP